MNLVNKTKVILDVDTGCDDAVAIMLAGKSPCIDLKAITVAAGNQVLEKTLKNTLNVCSYLGIKDVPIAGGMTRPLLRDRITGADIHGDSGLGGTNFGEPELKADKHHAVDLLIKMLLNSDGDITLVPVAPLTNIAMAIRKEPGIIPKIKKIVMMGGALGLGNCTPASEFNIFADPEAAQIVFSCGRPIVMIGLDLTMQALATNPVMKKIGSINNNASKLFIDMMTFYKSAYKETMGIDSPAVHDPTTIAYLIDPSIISTIPMYVEVDTNKSSCYGRTLCDKFGTNQKKPNAEVAVKLDFDKFWDTVYDVIKLYK